MHLSVSDYNIEFGAAGDILKSHLDGHKYSSINVLVDDNTHEHCLSSIKSALDSYNLIKISSGEEHKTLQTCHQIWSELQEYNVDRHGLLINLGGGVIGDMGGFVASTYMRGIDFLQIPTTLLSQVDASVGGKLGVDFNGFKNFIGLFKNPKIVIIDSSFFDTLPDNELRSGYAEMIKHALIRDQNIWQQYINNDSWRDNLTSKDLLDSVNIKREVVLEDPFEGGLRKILNFGHTLGHAIETYSFKTEKPLLHGYAIALGMIGEAYIAHTLLDVSEQELQSIKAYLESIYKMEKSYYKDYDAIMSNLKHDKKNKSGKVLFSILKSTGHCTYDIEVPKALIKESLEYTLT